MNNEDIGKWCHEEMRALADSPMYARGHAYAVAAARPWARAVR